MSAPKIPDGPEWDRVRNIFCGTGLDPNNPEHWPILVKAAIQTTRALLKVVRRQPGRELEWEPVRLIKLAHDIDRLQREHPDKSESDLCRFLSREEGYRGLKAGTLRRRLQDARDPKFSGAPMMVYEPPSDELDAAATLIMRAHVNKG